MRYSLDTNTCIRYINGRVAQLRQKIPICKQFKTLSIVADVL